jgi:hypothetical protein
VNEENLLTKIVLARSNIVEAEGSLARLIGEIEIAARAEKTGVTAGVEAALEKLRAALAHLDGLEAELAALSG